MYGTGGPDGPAGLSPRQEKGGRAALPRESPCRIRAPPPDGEGDAYSTAGSAMLDKFAGEIA
jgi:hypothetical protein